MEYQNEQHPSNDPTMRTYGLNCKVHVVRTVGQQGVKSGQSEFQAVALIPNQSDSTSRFFAAWLPDSSDEKFEIVFEMGHPVYGVCRGAVMRRSRVCNQPHIFIMSLGVEEILKHQHGENINIKVLPATSEDRSHEAPDTEADIDVII